MKSLCVVLAFCSCAALAQSSAPQSPFDEGVPPPSKELQQRLAGKVFNVKLADGGGWRFEYKTNGYFFLNTNAGFSDTGEWKTQDGKVCHTGRKIGSSCNEMRVNGDGLYMKRDSGEIVQFVVQ